MRYLFTIIVLAAAALGQCPLGFTPDEACSADNPSCGLFTDANGDGLCDNPGPAEVESEPEPEPEPEIEQEPELEPESEPETEPEVEASGSSCPLGFTPAQACPSANPSCALFVDGNSDALCDNPGPQPVENDQEPPVEVESTDHVEVVEETDETNPEEQTDEAEQDQIQCPMGFSLEEACAADDPLCALFRDADGDQVCDNAIIQEIQEAGIDSVTQPEAAATSYECPLGFTPEEACLSDNPSCALYTDNDGDGLCDNPSTDCIAEDTTCGLETPSIIGCPLGLPPEGACPDSLALCPHWYGVTSNTSCSNPAGGSRRVNIILISLGVLLPLSTVLSRRYFGRKLKDRLKRNTAHHVIRGVSLMVLGFGVQGCFCPLGTFQYAFTEHGLAFLGLSGLLIFLLPIVFSAFFGRIFCGWVCPMGAIQEFLFRIHVPGRFSPRGKLHRKLRYLSHVILFALVGIILLNRFGIVTLRWSAPFCQIDPFHTIFTLFLSGSLIIAGVTIILAIFIRRFFCRYLCFYGAAQAIVSRLRLYSRIKGSSEVQPEISSDEEFDK